LNALFWLEFVGIRTVVKDDGIFGLPSNLGHIFDALITKAVLSIQSLGDAAISIQVVNDRIRIFRHTCCIDN